MKKSGHVYLVGAGPGDPGLITQTGLSLLRSADVVLFDALSNPALLAHAPDAEHIDCGKRANRHKLTQDETNALLVLHAKEGKTVVRLKGGDPYLFGRGAEEVAHCARHGIRCEVVPGITAGIAAPMMAGIPVTHRHLASNVTFVTGHEDPTKDETSIDYDALGKLIQRGGTVCFYMGVARLGAIASALVGAGVDTNTPAAIVQWGTLPSHRHLRSTLSKIEAEVVTSKIGSPAIIIVGQVAGIDEPGLDFFTNRPLFGKRIMITRTRQQTSSLREGLESLGASVLEAPTIQLVPPDDWRPVDEAIEQIAQYDWLVLTSANAVHALANRLVELERDARQLASVRLAVIGQATSDALWDRLRLRADFTPSRFVAESLAGEMLAQQDVEGKRFLLLRADIARPALPRLLNEAGADVTECVVYQTKQADALPENVMQSLRDGEVDWITFTSSSTATN